jgi:hypothetical protein
MTEPGPFSFRFPVKANEPSGHDSNFVMYEADEVAGFSPLGQGPRTDNMVLSQQLYVTMQGIHLTELDTIGGTTYDLQACGPVHPTLSCAPGHGVHALWSYSGETSDSFPDLNTRYNFYDFSIGAWNWVDPDYMQSGVNVFFPLSNRASGGCLAIEPATGVAVVSGCKPPILPHVAVEETPSDEVRTPNRRPTIVRGVLVLAADRRPGTEDRATLLDIAGRLVMWLRPGTNDVRALSPGVYFVRERLAVGGERSSVTKVVVAE